MQVGNPSLGRRSQNVYVFIINKWIKLSRIWINYVYYKNITDACSTYYNNVTQNTHILNKLSKVLSENFDLELKIINLKHDKVKTNKTGISKRKYTFQSGVRFLKRQLINLMILKRPLKMFNGFGGQPLVSMVFNGQGPLFKRWNGFNGSNRSECYQ